MSPIPRPLEAFRTFLCKTPPGRLLRLGLLPLLALYVTAAPLHAQVRTTGQINGTVRDASGAIVAGVQIEVQDVNTNNTLTAKSGADGGFVFAALQPGTYRLLATSDNFQPSVVDNIVIATGRTTDVPVQLEVGPLTEEVRVEAGVSVVETTSNTISSTVRNAEIAKLPLLGRNVLDFALLVPGANQSASGRNSQFNGLPGAAINITLDGVNNNSQRFRSGGTSFFTFAPVRLGAMEEVTVSTAGLTADAGAEGAAQIQFITRRGTNQWRGQIFEQLRNDALNANSVLNNARDIQKSKLRLNEFGGNIGGPIIRNKLFFFGNYEQIIQPSMSNRSALVLTPAAQQGEFRYVDAAGATRSANVLDIARAAGYSGTLDPFIVAQLATINGSLGQASVQSTTDLIRQDVRWQEPNDPKNVYPTTRVDYQVSPSLSIRGILNLQWRDLARFPLFPGLDLNTSGFDSTYYILSTGADWTIKPNLINQFSFGYQSNAETFNRHNSADVYASRRVPFPTALTLGGTTLTSPTPTNNVLPNPRNNPVYNLSNTLTLLKGNHTFTFGGTIRYTSMWDQSWGGAAGGPSYNLGVTSDDPVASIFNTSTMPGIRTADLPTARGLYAMLTGRLSGINGTINIDESSHEFGANPLTSRESQMVGGLYIQDAWRVSPEFTLNYGFRWEFSGAAKNANGIYTSPTLEHLLGPSVAPFQPGTLSGITDPQIDLRPEPYKGDYVNPAPNVGFAWNPQGGDGGFIERLFGKGKSVIRGGVGLNYFDEGLINFQNNASGNPGLTQQLSLQPGQPGFQPGGLTLGSNIPALNVFPQIASFPISQSQFTFTRGYQTIDPDIKTPSILNWNIGIQRELWKNSAFEARYVGNRGFNLWRAYDMNEVNVFENGFVDDFKAAQRNLQINRANGRTGFANNGLPGQVATPFFDAAFGARGSLGAVPATTGYGNGTFIDQLDQGEAGRLAAALAGTNTYLCRMVGNNLAPCATLGYNAPGVYPINVFQANPFAAGSNIIQLSDPAWSSYHGLQLQLRQRLTGGLTMTSHYTLGSARTDRWADSPGSRADYTTLRDQSINDGPSVYDLRHTFQSFFTYELPFGKDRRFPIGNAILEQIAGGWMASGIVRVQSGRAFRLTSARQTFNNRESGVVLNGTTVDELQSMVNVRPGPAGSVFFFDERLIGADGRANSDLVNSPTAPGELGQFVYLYGPGFWNVDLGLAKRIMAGSRVSINFEALMLNAFNHPNFLVGGDGAENGSDVSINGTTFGLTSTTSGNPRNIQLRLQINF